MKSIIQIKFTVVVFIIIIYSSNPFKMDVQYFSRSNKLGPLWFLCPLISVCALKRQNPSVLYLFLLAEHCVKLLEE